MLSKSIRSSELGSTCWLPIRFFAQCWKCDRYWRCTLAVRVVSDEYERLVRDYKAARKRLEKFTGKEITNGKT